MPEATQKDSNIIALLSYFGLLFAIIIYLLKKDDRFVRFHAMQAILLDLIYMIGFGIVWVIYMVSFIGMFASFAIGTFLPLPFLLIPIIFLFGGIGLLLKLFLMYKAYKRERYKLPVLGTLAEKHSS